MKCSRVPSRIYHEFGSLVSMVPIRKAGPHDLWSINSRSTGVTVKFSINHVNVSAPPGVVRATKDYFTVRRRGPSKAALVLTRSIPGPQEIEVEVHMEIYRNNTFSKKAIEKFFIFVSKYEF